MKNIYVLCWTSHNAVQVKTKREAEAMMKVWRSKREAEGKKVRRLGEGFATVDRSEAIVLREYAYETRERVFAPYKPPRETKASVKRVNRPRAAQKVR